MSGWSIDCHNHNYITLYYDGKFVECYDNNLNEYYYAENIIAAIEKRTRMKITDIPVKGKINDFDGLRFLYGGFKKGSEFINQNQI